MPRARAGGEGRAGGGEAKKLRLFFSVVPAHPTACAMGSCALVAIGATGTQHAHRAIGASITRNETEIIQRTSRAAAHPVAIQLTEPPALPPSQGRTIRAGAGDAERAAGEVVRGLCLVCMA